MKALVKSHAGPGLWMENVPIPKPGALDVLVKIRQVSICGTDIHIYDWDEWAAKTIPVGMTVGHEFVGEVVSVGQGVTTVEVGDIVTGDGHVVCGVCRNCRSGRPAMCPNTTGIGVNINGAFAEYLTIPAINTVKCEPGIPEEFFSCFDPFGNAVHSACMFPVLGEDVLITGAGPIGIMAAAVCRHAGARHVVITDLNPYRLELAGKMGVKHAINPIQTPLKDYMNQLGMKEGFDVGLEMSGSPHAFNDLVDSMANGGKIAMLGMQAKGTSIDWDKVVFNMLTIKGIYGREMYESWHKMQMFLQSGLDLSPIITHKFSFDEYEEGFRVMKSGESGKIVLAL
ncbi:MAG: L-threonine 3-dehydrogenase [Defluviitaleaceae bacterium]|nr:L-threonine 3-dehydrogenase [Defluviitaleaceae bacterium]